MRHIVAPYVVSMRQIDARHNAAGAALTRHAIRAQVVPRRESLHLVLMLHNVAPYLVSMRQSVARHNAAPRLAGSGPTPPIPQSLLAADVARHTASRYASLRSARNEATLRSVVTRGP